MARFARVLRRLSYAVVGLSVPEEPDAAGLAGAKETGSAPVLLQLLVGLAVFFISKYVGWSLFPASIPGPGCSWWQAILVVFVSIRIGYFTANLVPPRRRVPTLGLESAFHAALFASCV